MPEVSETEFVRFLNEDVADSFSHYLCHEALFN